MNARLFSGSRVIIPLTQINPMMRHVRNVVPQIEAVHNLRKVRMYFNVLSLRSTT